MKIFRNLICFIIIACSVALLVLPSAADCPPGWSPVGPGPKVGGPNRRVLSPTGYGAAKGSFSRLGEMHLYLPKDQNGMPTNPNGDRPTFYLGAKGSGFEIDAGAQYEPLFFGTVAPGWIRFMRVTVGGCSKWLPTKGAKPNPRRTDLSDVATEFTLTQEGIATLSMWGPDNLTCNLREVASGPLNVASMQMKRNIGLTQSAGFTIDGSTFLRTEFTGGQVRKWRESNGQWTLDAYDDWPLNSSTENTSTGKSPAGQRWIDCEPPWKRLSDGADQSPTAHSPSRFFQEKVNIDLRGKKIDTKKLQHGNN